MEKIPGRKYIDIKSDEEIQKEKESSDRMIRSSESNIACNLAKITLFNKAEACLDKLFLILTNLNELLKQEVNKPKK
jgi:hypothetical protein